MGIDAGEVVALACEGDVLVGADGVEGVVVECGMDGKVESGKGVAAVLRQQTVKVDSGSIGACKGAVTEEVGLVVADFGVGVVVIERVHYEVHGDDGVGTSVGGEDGGACQGGHLAERGVEGYTVPGVWQRTVAEGVVEGCVDVTIDEEGVIDDAVALYTVGECYIEMADAVGEGGTVVCVGKLVLDDGVGLCTKGRVAYGEVEGGDGVAANAVGGEVGRGVGGGCIVGAVPGEEVAVVGEGVAGGCSADIETEDAEGVAVVGGGVEEMRVESCVGAVVGGVLEGILLVVADGVGNGVVIDGSHMETHDDGGVGARGRGDDDGAHHGDVGRGGVERDIVPRDWQLVEADVAVETGACVPVDMEGVGDD